MSAVLNMTANAPLFGRLHRLDSDLRLLNKEWHQKDDKYALCDENVKHIIPERYLRIESDPDILLAIADSYLKRDDIAGARTWLTETLTHFPAEYFKFLANGIRDNRFTMESVLLLDLDPALFTGDAKWIIAQRYDFSCSCAETVASLTQSRKQNKPAAVSVLKAMIRMIDDVLTQERAFYRYAEDTPKGVFSTIVRPRLEKMGFPTDLINSFLEENCFNDVRFSIPPVGF